MMTITTSQALAMIAGMQEIHCLVMSEPDAEHPGTTTMGWHKLYPDAKELIETSECLYLLEESESTLGHCLLCINSKGKFPKLGKLYLQLDTELQLCWREQHRYSKSNASKIQYEADFEDYHVIIHHHIDYGDNWLLTCRALSIDKMILGESLQPPFLLAEKLICKSLREQRQHLEAALSCLGILPEISVETPTGTIFVQPVRNEDLPGITADLIPSDGTTPCNLLCLQTEDDGTLRVTVYAELGSNPCNGGKNGEYSHSIRFTMPNELPDADVSSRWASCGNRAALSEAARQYDYLVAKEIVIGRMAEKGYTDPETNHPKQLDAVISAYLKNIGFGCDEDFSLSDAMNTLL